MKKTACFLSGQLISLELQSQCPDSVSKFVLALECPSLRRTILPEKVILGSASDLKICDLTKEKDCVD